ncbi:MAG TPA: Hsp70 family protein [Vicinamibacterales bacterium]
MSSRYVVGIDLGTTNCAMAVVDASAGDASRPEVIPVAQLIAPGEIGSPSLLPSFLFIPGANDFAPGATALPWDPAPPFVVGELARRRGGENPGRLVASAKSWLSHARVDRTAAILPHGAAPEVPRVSPVEASAACLRHLAAAWKIAQGDQGSLADQEVLVTVPASFDEEARELTLRAAHEAGLGEVRLLEEPQAAFYAWLAHAGDRWRDLVQVGDLILVCDVGGGTTDFSLIAVTEQDGSLGLTRVAVGDHILLGGDNMDLALARRLQSRLESEGHRIDGWQLQQLWQQCRPAKEQLFSNPDLDSATVTILGRGSRLIGGTITASLTRADLDEVVLEGFLPAVDASERPQRQRRVGLQELGLPYAADAAITRHLARFLGELAADATEGGVQLRRGRSGLAAPTHLLFNGGVMKAAPVRQRIADTINRWLVADGFEPLGPGSILESADLDHAVALGAAHYGVARRGRGIRIRSGAPRTYYIGVESAMPSVPGFEAPIRALCVVPFGMEEGTEAAIPNREFGLVVGEPVEFRFLSSTTRKQDAVGDLVEEWDEGEMEELTPLEATLDRAGHDGSIIPVGLESRVTELGTLELWLTERNGNGRWKLEMNIREPRT